MSQKKGNKVKKKAQERSTAKGKKDHAIAAAIIGGAAVIIAAAINQIGGIVIQVIARSGPETETVSGSTEEAVGTSANSTKGTAEMAALTQEQELEAAPRFIASLQKGIFIGGQKYYSICLINANKNFEVRNGQAGLTAGVNVKEEGLQKENYHMRNVLGEDEVKYDECLDGFFIYIRQDYVEHVERVRMEHKVENNVIIECIPYVLVYLSYQSGGYMEGMYYLVEIMDGGEIIIVTQLKNARQYICGIEIPE